ncbi:protein NO VEIN domain-containing protein [Lentzea sp. NPDC059081]|uniref:protein NO VEIN domain-containing protein n=1 Tax=Lentzea sp. NPDC059081 TaxID=3346719 RepID=UPI0036856E97
MKINAWWAGDPAERYWMEVTDRPDPGVDVNAPQRNARGIEEWSYSLVTELRPGDVVFHWHRTLLGRPALAGWSVVTGPLAEEDDYVWQARGTYGRARGIPTIGRGWRMRCGGFNRLERPLDRARVAELRPVLEEVFAGLKERFGESLYLPFIFYRSNEVRAAQAYLTKFPAALVHAIPELTEVEEIRQAFERDAPREPSTLGRLQDVALRLAVERYSVDMAKEHYLGLGATQIDELGKPYDLRVLGIGPERHVEVKGSTSWRAEIELTVNEVRHARNHPTDLVVVDRIHAVNDGLGGWDLSGGELRVWSDWSPEDDRLTPTRYCYTLPD